MECGCVLRLSMLYFVFGFESVLVQDVLIVLELFVD